MKLKYILLILFSILAIKQICFTQAQRVFWIKVNDDNSLNDTATMWFGNHSNARYAIPDTLTFWDLGTIKETLAPPLPPGFGCVWYNIPGRVNTWDQGLLSYDFRPFPISIDTFRIKFQNSDHPSATFIFRWSKELFSLHGGNGITCKAGSGMRVDMLNKDSLVVPNAGDSSVTFFYIFTTVGDGINDGYEFQINDFKLNPNYPNPFNPSTNISYQLLKESDVTLKIYDLLGREIVTLLEERKPRGEYHVPWSAVGVPSGVYYYRLTAGNFIETKKMILMK
jgi:hypothetical protein